MKFDPCQAWDMASINRRDVHRTCQSKDFDWVEARIQRMETTLAVPTVS